MTRPAIRIRWQIAVLLAAIGLVTALALEVATRLGGPTAARHVVVGAGAATVVGLAAALVAVILRPLHDSLEGARARLRTINSIVQPIPGTMASWAFYASALAGRPLHLTSYSLEPEAALWLLDAIARIRPATVLEFGSGVSTLVAAVALRQQGSGHVIAIEEDAAWTARVNLLLQLNALENWAEVHCCPLRVREETGDQPWYDLDGVSVPERVDLVLVDGPSAGRHPTIRQPALPFAWDRLGVGGELLLDDAARDGEREVVRRWKDRLGDRIEVEEIATGRGVSRVRKVKP